MAQTKLLLDSNVYFRLAKEIHPLLFQEFGDECYCLYVLEELQAEYDCSPVFKPNFHGLTRKNTELTVASR